MANLLGYAASCAVLATFLMRTMTPLRFVAILSNVLFLSYGYVEHIYPVFFLHVILLPINCWRLRSVRNNANRPWRVAKPVRAANFAVSPPMWFMIGLLAGAAGCLIFIGVADA
jgi:hypothetical protein